MVKKLIKATVIVGLIAGGLWVGRRLIANPKGLVPLPYAFTPSTVAIRPEAPILLVGDRVGARFALFKEALALNTSTGLSKPIRIQSLARDGEGLHRTLHQLNSLQSWPQVLIYHGGSQEFSESKFLTDQIPGIQRNFRRYHDDRALTAMMLWPFLSRLIYEPITRVKLNDTLNFNSKQNFSDTEFQQRLEITYRLYELELNQLVIKARDNKALLILMTTPVNIDTPPKKTCSNAQSGAIAKEVREIRELIRQQDYKSALTRSQTLKDTTMANAEVLYLHGQIAFRNGLRNEAIESLRLAAVFDCQGHRANEVTNSIIRKVAKEQRVTLFDFAALVEKDWNRNVTFFDETYAQDLYYEKAAQYLAVVLKRVLKL